MGFHFVPPRVPASKLSPQAVSFLAFACHLPAPQWLQGDARGGVKTGIEMSPRASFQLSFQHPQGARFGFYAGVPRGPSWASTPASPGGPVEIPFRRHPGARFGFHFGAPRVPASKLNPQPVKILAFAHFLPAPQWLQGDGSGGVNIGIETSARASFQLSFQLPLGARFGFHFSVPRGPGLASTSASPGCLLRLPLRRPPGARFKVEPSSRQFFGLCRPVASPIVAAG